MYYIYTVFHMKDSNSMSHTGVDPGVENSPFEIVLSSLKYRHDKIVNKVFRFELIMISLLNKCIKLTLLACSA